MEILILLVSLIILGETSFLVLAKRRPVKSGKRKIYVDTSALIDGRILEVARTGFLDGDLVVLKDVLLELQLLADSRDADKRSNARAGLEVVSELERVINVNTEIIDEKTDSRKVDEILLKIVALSPTQHSVNFFFLVKLTLEGRVITHKKICPHLHKYGSLVP